VVTTVATSEKAVIGKEVETNTAERYTGRSEKDALLVAAAGATDEQETSVSYFEEHVEFDEGLEAEAVTTKSKLRTLAVTASRLHQPHENSPAPL